MIKRQSGKERNKGTNTLIMGSLKGKKKRRKKQANGRDLKSNTWGRGS